MIRILLAVTTLASLATVRVSDAATFDELFQRIPETANAFIVFDVEKLLASRVAQDEKWKQTYADEYSASPLAIPPDAKRVVVGTELNIASMTPAWEAASMELSVQGTAEEMAVKVGGVADTLADTSVVWVQDKFCVAQFSPNHVGILTPTTRQNAARWIRQTSRPHDEDSPYLKRVLAYAEQGTPEILMAIDLQDLLRPAEVRHALLRSKLFEASVLGEVTDLLAGIRGMTLAVRVEDAITGRLVLDFSEDAFRLKQVAKPLLLDVLRSAGAMIDEFENWDAQVDGSRVSLTGALSSDSVRRLLSVFSLDSASVQRAPQEVEGSPLARTDVPETPPTGAQEPIGVSETSSLTDTTGSADVNKYKTQNYYRAVTGYLKDLQKPRSEDFSEIALWIDSYARKIERLSIKSVDPDLVAFADRVVYQLRDVVASLHGTVDQAWERTAAVQDRSNISVGAVPTFRSVNYGGFRRRSYAPMAFSNVDVGAAQERNLIAADAYQKGSRVAQDTMAQIKAETGDIHKQMQDRYGFIF